MITGIKRIEHFAIISGQLPATFTFRSRGGV
jgi:hypothetical protein